MRTGKPCAVCLTGDIREWDGPAVLLPRQRIPKRINTNPDFAWLRRAKPKVAFCSDRCYRWGSVTLAGLQLVHGGVFGRQARLLPQSHFVSRLLKKAISAELTSSAFSCCVQCPQSGNIIVRSSLGTNCLRLAISWSIPGNFTTRSRSPAM